MLQVILEYTGKFGDEYSARVVFWRYPRHSNYFVVGSYQLEHYFWKLGRENWMIEWIPMEAQTPFGGVCKAQNFLGGAADKSSELISD